MNKYFLHRIQKQNGEIVKGIEVHDSLESAVLAFHGRMKLAYGANAEITFMDCKIMDSSGNILRDYNETWNGEDSENIFFLHYIRLDGEAFTKNIDMFESFNPSKAALHAQMEYGYNNARFPNVSFVSGMISDGSGAVIMSESWTKPVSEPAE